MLRQRYPELEKLWHGVNPVIVVNNEQVTSPDQRLARDDGQTVEVNILILRPVMGGCPGANAVCIGE